MSSITLRPFDHKEDRAFVTTSFLHTYGQSAYAKGVSAKILIDLLDPLLITWDTTVAVAPDGELLGWICSRQPDAIAWIYVKSLFRETGLATALIEHSGIGKLVNSPFVPTRLFTQPFQNVAREKGYQVRFRPYLPLLANPIATEETA